MKLCSSKYLGTFKLYGPANNLCYTLAGFVLDPAQSSQYTIESIVKILCSDCETKKTENSADCQNEKLFHPLKENSVPYKTPVR